jgi:hypothetical protein
VATNDRGHSFTVSSAINIQWPAHIASIPHARHVLYAEVVQG